MILNAPNIAMANKDTLRAVNYNHLLSRSQSRDYVKSSETKAPLQSSFSQASVKALRIHCSQAKRLTRLASPVRDKLNLRIS